MILYKENPKVFTKNLLELINEFSKVAGYNIQKCIAFIYSNNELSEAEIKKTIPFINKSTRVGIFPKEICRRLRGT